MDMCKCMTMNFKFILFKLAEKLHPNAGVWNCFQQKFENELKRNTNEIFAQCMLHPVYLVDCLIMIV